MADDPLRPPASLSPESGGERAASPGTPRGARANGAAGAGAPGFPIVGIGASAGGLRAIQSFFSALPARPGMAFVVVQHLSPDHESALAELVQTRTEMEVTPVTDRAAVAPNRVYVIPPGKHLEIEGGRLSLVDPVDRHGRPLAVDRFLQTLAEDAGARAVCVVLSGTGSDGAIGLQAVKERDGLTMVQGPHDAAYDGMPRSAIGTGHVDVTGTAEELAATLVRVRSAAGLVADRGRPGPLPPDLAPGWADPGLSDPALADGPALQAIFDHLRQRTGHDFSDYKRSTIHRRLARRMQAHGLPSIEAYAQLLQSDADEAQALLHDFLISVTRFFRDAEAFEALRHQVIPGLFEGKGRGDQVRAWVAGCATGQEAYSVAMLLCEHRDTLADPPEVQVFATDIDQDALAKARAGVYPAAALADLSPERQRAFFEVAEDGVRITEDLRAAVLFASHDLLSDPPFSRLDLITCRNVLIYLTRTVQARVFRAFHYGLRTGGALFLGSSEGSEPLTRGFVEFDKTARLYRRRDVDLGATAFASRSERAGPVGLEEPPHPPAPSESLVRRYGQWTLDAYAPPRLLVNEQGEVSHVFGRAGDYLRDREGPVTQRVAEKVLPVFRVDLQAALYRAFATGEPTDTPFHALTVDGDPRVVRLHVGMAGGPVAGERLAEAVFIELDPASVASLAVAPPADAAEGPDAASRFQRELAQAQERLQATIEAQETSKEEIRASNEELQSMNEELQSATEELETSKEELQSMNEELQTLNQELKTKIEELTRSNADLQNLVASTEIATLFLDRQLRVARFTPAAADVFNLIQSDVGRPLEHVTHRLDVDDLTGLARRVLSTLGLIEETVPGRDGGGYALRMLPYQTVDGRVEGVVITVTDVTDLRDAREEALRRVRQQEAIAAFGRYVLATTDVSAVFDRAAQLVAEAIRVPLVEVLEHDVHAGLLRLVAGVGWEEGAVGASAMPDGIASQGGYTLATPAPVVVPDLAIESRFVGPDLLLGQGGRSGVTVRIEGPDGAPWGVLGAHAREPRAFNPTDGRFMEAMAAVLGAALVRRRDHAVIQEHAAEIEAVYATAPVGLAFLDEHLRYRRINQHLADINGVPVEAHLGRSLHEVIPDIAQEIGPLLRHALQTGEPVEDVEIRGLGPAAPHEERVWLCNFVPFVANGGAVGVSLVVRDITDRKRAEDAVRASEERLRLAMQAGRLGTFRRDFADDTLEFDARCQEIYGVPPGEPAASALERVHPGDRPAVMAALARAVDPVDPADDYVVQHRLQVANEPPRWLSVQAHVRFEDDGPGRRPVEMVGVALDVTPMKETERDLEDARARLALALDVGDAGTYEMDLVSGQMIHDEGVQRLLGLPAVAPLADVMVSVHPEDRDVVEARIGAAADPANPDDTFRSVHRHLHPDGRVLWVTSRGVTQFEGEGRRPTRLIGTLADITDLKEAQDVVRRQLLEIDAYFDAVPVAIAVFDRRGRYVRINGSMEGMVGVPLEELAGTHPSDHAADDRIDASQPFLRRVLESGEPIRDVEMRLPAPHAPGGALHDWLLNYVPLTEDGEVTGVTVVVQDVTALKRAQAGFESLSAELEARVVMRTAEVRRLVGDLTEAERRERGRVAQILHDDLQQLLYAVQFKFEAMRRAEPAAQGPLLAGADDLIARAVQVTRTLTVDLSPPVLKGEGLDRTFEWLAHSMEEAYGLQVTVEREGDVQVGKTVQVLLFQIVRELLFNVVKHAGTATATVGVGLQPNGSLRVVVTDEGAGFETDEGAGFETDDLGTGEDVGYGLLSVRERIRLVGGTVAVESSSGEGTRIVIVCPAEL